MEYKANEIKNWDCNANVKGKWILARPVQIYSFTRRLKLAWYVFIGKYDALDWDN
jgi:hypothetical protein